MKSPMKKAAAAIIAALVLLVLLFLTGAIYTVREDEQVVLTKFGKPVGEPVTDAGLHFKMPFITKVNTFEKRALAWDGQSTMMNTLEKTAIQVDTFARWEISEPLVFFKALRNERSAQSRLDDILVSQTLSAVASNNLIEIVRSTTEPGPGEPAIDAGDDFDPVTIGRRALEKMVFEAARKELVSLGINLLDLRFKRINYDSKTANEIYTRMITERQQVAEKFRSEGAGEAARTMGRMEREVKEIESTAYRKVQSILGEADAESTRIYAEAYGGTKEREEFYKFVKTLEAYDDILDGNTTVILSTDSELFRLLNGSSQAPKADE